MSQPTYELSGGQILLFAIQVIIVCFGSLMIGIKIDTPSADMPLDMPIVLLAVCWSIIGLAYVSSVLAIKKWYLRMAVEAHEEEAS